VKISPAEEAGTLILPLVIENCPDYCCLYVRECSRVRQSRDLTQLPQFAADAPQSRDDRTLLYPNASKSIYQCVSGRLN
ncbi:hypothetical protein QUB70_24600, partial [Microcoleus sp. A003_D6]|uniref:hypothetical protein n=1 Tax=Microcoleus sp. A003_D6 TaxID=3055266 RepID=UPI002FD04E58